MDRAGDLGGPRVVAHRGYHGNGGPLENTMAAFERAMAAGVDAVELDVRRTRDGSLVVYHDPELADGRRIGDLDAADLPRLPGGARIPLLADVARLAGERGARLVVEPKERGYEHELLRQVMAELPASRFEVISFNASTIEAVEAAEPAVRTGLLAPRVPGWLRDSALMPAAVWLMDRAGWQPGLDRAERVGADYVSVAKVSATPRFLGEAARRGMAVDVWTVDDPATMRRLRDAGVQGIVTDRPDLAIRVRDGASRAQRQWPAA